MVNTDAVPCGRLRRHHWRIRLDVTAKLKVGESENVHTYNIWIIANVVSGDDIWTLVDRFP